MLAGFNVKGSTVVNTLDNGGIGSIAAQAAQMRICFVTEHKLVINSGGTIN